MVRRIFLTEDADTDDVDYASEDFDYEEYADPDDYYAEDGQAAQGLFGSPARAVTLLFSLLLLLAVGGTVIWMLSTRNVAGAAASGSSIDTAGLSVAPSVGSLAPDFELLDVHTNKPVKLSSLRGKPVFINFWGTWCPPCRAEMPEMQKLNNKFPGQIEILGITMGPRDEPAGVKAFVDAASYNWTFIHDPDYNVASVYQVQAIPSSFFIDKAGVIRAMQVGAMNEAQMEVYFEKIRY